MARDYNLIPTFRPLEDTTAGISRVSSMFDKAISGLVGLAQQNDQRTLEQTKGMIAGNTTLAAEAQRAELNKLAQLDADKQTQYQSAITQANSIADPKARANALTQAQMLLPEVRNIATSVPSFSNEGRAIEDMVSINALNKQLEPFINTAQSAYDRQRSELLNRTGDAVKFSDTGFNQQRLLDQDKRSEEAQRLNWAQFNAGRQDQAFNRQISGLQLQNQLIAAERARLSESLKGLPLDNPTRIEANAKLQSLEEQALSNQYKLAGLYGIDVSNFNTKSQYLGGNPTQVSNTTNVPVTTNVSTSTNVANTPVDWRQMLREQAGSFGEAGMPITSSGALKSTPVGFVDERQVVSPNVQQNVIQQPVAPARVIDTRQIGMSRSEAKKATTDNTQNQLSGFSQIPPTNYVNPVQEKLKKDLVNIQNNVTYNTQPSLEGTLSNLSGSSDTLQSQLDLLLQKAKEDVVAERMSKVNVPVGSVTYTEILKEQLSDPSLESAARSKLNLDSGYRTVQSTKTNVDNEKKVFENYLKSRKEQSPEFLGDLRAAANEYVDVGNGSTFGDKYTNAPLVTAVTRLAQVDPKLSSYITGDKPTLESLQNRKKSDYTRMVESAKDYVKYNAPASAMLDDALKEFRAKSGREEVDVKSAANLINTLIEALGKIEAK